LGLYNCAIMALTLADRGEKMRSETLFLYYIGPEIPSRKRTSNHDEPSMSELIQAYCSEFLRVLFSLTLHNIIYDIVFLYVWLITHAGSRFMR